MLNTQATQRLALPSLVQGNLEGIDQGICLLESLTDDQYNYDAKPYVESGIGPHLRHINDLYFALIAESHSGEVDYDVRRRGAKIETCRQTAIEEFKQIKHWLLSLNQDDVQRKVNISTETSIYQQFICKTESTLGRELIFVASHTTHHFAVVRVITEFCKVPTQDIFSYAPATATYLRGLKNVQS